MVKKKGTKKPAARKPKRSRTRTGTAPRVSAASRAPRRSAPPKLDAEETKKIAKTTPAAEVSEGPLAFGLHNLLPVPGATHSRKRVGRGPGSGHGKTAGRGNKGQKSRAGYRHLRGFEGGQMPLHRRVPKRGFTNIFRVEYDVVNLSDLDRFAAGSTVTPDALAEKRLARGSRPVKVLGGGELQKPLQVSAHKFSASARARIEAAGGRCEVLKT